MNTRHWDVKLAILESWGVQYDFRMAVPSDGRNPYHRNYLEWVSPYFKNMLQFSENKIGITEEMLSNLYKGYIAIRNTTDVYGVNIGRNVRAHLYSSGATRLECIDRLLSFYISIFTLYVHSV
jgi:hypothetical protein